MTTEEMIQEMGPLSLELEYADEPRGAAEAHAAEEPLFGGPLTEETAEQRSKKEQILSLYEAGTTDIAEIVRRVKARPSYVAQVLQSAGRLEGYFDLYTTTGKEQNVYSRYFRNVLAFRNVEAARESVRRIDRLYNYFERLGDRAGDRKSTRLNSSHANIS